MRKWYSKIKIKVINKKGVTFIFNTIALIDPEEDLNYIQEGQIPSIYFEKTYTKLPTTLEKRMKIEYKIPEAYIGESEEGLKLFSMLVNDLSQHGSLGTPFLCLIEPFAVTKEGITTKIKDKNIFFKFYTKIEEEKINMLNEQLKGKVKFLIELQSEIKDSEIKKKNS